MLGADAVMALIKRLPNVESVIVCASNEMRVFPGLQKRITLLVQPTDAP